MFETKKFKKKYPLLTEFITDKKKMKKFLEDKNLYELYLQENETLDKFITNIKKVYNSEKVENIVMDIINAKDYKKLKIVSYNLNQFISWYKSYNGNLDSINEIDWLIIENKGQKFNGFEIEEITLNMCFVNNYKNPIYINNHDIKDIFIRTNSLVTKRKLYSLLKNNNLDFFVFIMNKLSKYNIEIENIDSIFESEVDDRIYNPEITNKMSEQDFLRLIIYYFDIANKREKEIINNLIDAKNYELISDILHLKSRKSFFDLVKADEIDKDLLSLKNINVYQIYNILYDILSPKEKLDIEYLNNLSYSIGRDNYDEFYQKHKDLLDLLTKIHYENFCKLTKEEQKSIYTYIKSLTQDKKNILIEEIKQINLELRTLYRNEYLKVVKNSDNIINKAEDKEVKDTRGKKHNIRVYELKDEEPFTLLITVMHNKARDRFLNMYGRPAHKLTIDDPSNFCKDLKGGSEYISASMISDNFIETFVGPNADVMYVFSDLETEDFINICHKDAALPPKIEENVDLFLEISPVGPRELMIKTKHNRDYNEIAIRRKRKDNTRIMPMAILCFDKINDTSIKHAEYFNIPIIVINTKTYKNLKYYTETKEETYKIKR